MIELDLDSVVRKAAAALTLQSGLIKMEAFLLPLKSRMMVNKHKVAFESQSLKKLKNKCAVKESGESSGKGG